MEEENCKVVLDQEITFQPDLTYFIEAKLKIDNEGILRATPLKANGSGDFANLVDADGFLILPQQKKIFAKGEIYPFVAYRKINHLL